MEIKHLYLALALLATTFSMPGCDGDDDDDAKPDTEVNGGDSSDKDGDSSSDKDGDSSSDKGSGSTDKDGGSNSDTYNTPDKSVGGTVPTIAEAVDLGLTSGTLWAPYNVGATAPGEAGAYFAWGEVTADKSRYSWDYYKWTEDGGSTFTKYTTDGLTDLENADDAAAVNWGGKWVMPNRDQLKELFDNCSIEWKAEGEHAEGSLAGYRLTSKTNGASLFLPAAGLHWLSQHYDLGSYGYYWSAELCLGNSDYTHSLYFNSDNWHLDYNGRNCGQPVRPVICSSAK